VIVGGWVHRLAPLPGELLSSCLVRSALAHGTTPGRFLRLFWQGDPIWERDFDRAPAALRRTRRAAHGPDWLDDVAARLGVTRGAVEDATLTPWRVRLGGPSLAACSDTPLVLSAGIRHRRTRHALQFCPDCLAEGTPHFRRTWRLGFVVGCEAHGRALLDACPHCDAPVMPHRTMTGRLADCHLCGRGLDKPPHAPERAPLPASVVALQQGLSRVLRGGGPGLPGPWPGRDAFDAVRALLAASATEPVTGRLRPALGLDGRGAPRAGRLRFEQVRLDARVPHLETVAAWLADWPRAFRHGADAARLTQRAFVRRRLPPALAAEVARLDPGRAYDRSWKPILEEPVLRRLRRTDKAAYRQLRAQRCRSAWKIDPLRG